MNGKFSPHDFQDLGQAYTVKLQKRDKGVPTYQTDTSKISLASNQSLAQGGKPLNPQGFIATGFRVNLTPHDFIRTP
jgi:hypothetical protein